jgi:hypothetical protein
MFELIVGRDVVERRVRERVETAAAHRSVADTDQEMEPWLFRARSAIVSRFRAARPTAPASIAARSFRGEAASPNCR